MTSPVYHVTDVRFRHNHNRSAAKNWVFEGLSFAVSPGEFIGILGPNGSGKTSLLNLLARLKHPQAGTIRLFGENLVQLKQDAIARTVALVPQDYLPTFPFSVEESVLMGRFPHQRSDTFFSLLSGMGWESDVDRKIAWSAMQETNVAHLATRSIEAVSGGERQRVLIARALTQEPRVMLLDEPTAHLDLHHQMETCRLLRRLNDDRGLTVILVSHDLNLASQYCDRLLLLDHGRIVALGTPHEVLRAETLRAVYGCDVLVDQHPASGLPRITIPGRVNAGGSPMQSI
ncbi:MAG TPA: ABC transporter ATP-binding protein [Nitrospiraceae bacterium]|nr:ABC transporter ATP-binding protein [Nitrospiraceae bacterium]